MFKSKMLVLILLSLFSYSVYAEANIVENYIVNKDAMIKLRKTRKVSLEHFGNIDFFFLTDSLKCCPINLENFDFNPKKLTSTISSNQLLTLVAETGGNQRVVVIEDSSQLAVVDHKELFEKSVYFGYINTSLDSLQELNKEEILLSFFINNPFNFGMMNYREENIRYLADYLIKKVELSKSNKKYKILTKYKTNDKKIIFKNELIPAQSIKKICKYQFSKLVTNKPFDSLFPLIKEIALEEDIPIKGKTYYTNSLLNYYLEYSDDSINKTKYLDYILKVIEESQIKIGETVSNTNSDIEAMKSLFRNTEDEKISAKELFEVSKRILDISENPIVILQAYCGIQFYYLENHNLNKAKEISIESINKYSKPILWSYYKEPDYFNAKASLMFLDFLTQNENYADVVIDFIDKLIASSSSHPDFQNFLIYRKAIVKDLFSYPLKDVISAYKEIDMNPENWYVFNHPFSQIDFTRTIWKVETDILPNLQSFKKYTEEMDKSLLVKKNILSSSTTTITLDKSTEVIIHSHAPYLLTRFGNKDYFWWVKGEIYGEIYWIFSK